MQYNDCEVAVVVIWHYMNKTGLNYVYVLGFLYLQSEFLLSSSVVLFLTNGHNNGAILVKSSSRGLRPISFKPQAEI